MTAQILDGRKVAREIHVEVAAGIRTLLDDTGERPGLAVVLANDDPASRLYVLKKQEACREVGARCVVFDWRDRGGSRQPWEFVLDTLRIWGADGYVGDRFHGVLVQLPVLGCDDPQFLFKEIDPLRDVDVFHPENVGLLAQGKPRFRTCTPQGVITLLERHGVPLRGSRVAVVNASDIVGKPLALMLLAKGATVTVCHRDTPQEDVERVCRDSYIVVTAVGRPGFLRGDMVSPGAVVVDVGISRVGTKVVGDADFEAVSRKASWVTPVPGGCGPVTVATLLQNVLLAARLQVEKSALQPGITAL